MRHACIELEQGTRVSPPGLPLALAALLSLACLPAHAGGRNSVRIVIGAPVLHAPGFGSAAGGMAIGGTVLGGTMVGGQLVPAPAIQGYTPGSIYFGSSGSYTVVPMHRGARALHAMPLYASPLYAVPVPVPVPVQPAQAAQQVQVRYYCPDWNEYWPEAQSCPSAWLKVIP